MLSNGEGVSCYCTDVSHLLQHHCRACGQIFCGKCSSKYSTIPKFGIEKEVRVCEPCYEHLNKSVPFVVWCVSLPATAGTVRGEAWHGATFLQTRARVSRAGQAGLGSLPSREQGLQAVVLCRAGAPVQKKEHSVCTGTSF